MTAVPTYEKALKMPEQETKASESLENRLKH
jgi:hypothetical protein